MFNRDTSWPLLAAGLILLTALALVSLSSESRVVRSGPWDLIDTRTMSLEGSTITEKNASTITIEASELDLNGSLSVQEGSTLSSNLEVGGNANLLGTLSVTEGSTLSSDLQVGGDSNLLGTLSVTEGTTLSSGLQVNGAADLQSSLDVGTTLDVTGVTTLSDDLDINSDLLTIFTNDLFRLDETQLNNTLAVFAFGLGGVGLYSGPALVGDSAGINGLLGGAGGAMSIQTTDETSINTGAIGVHSGAYNGTGANTTGSATFSSGFIVNGSASGDTGGSAFISGYNYGSGASGQVLIRSGNTSSGLSGPVEVTTGDVSGGVNSGDTLIRTGNTTAQSGDLSLNTGSSGNQSGSIDITAGSASSLRGSVDISGGSVNIVSDGLIGLQGTATNITGDASIGGKLTLNGQGVSLTADNQAVNTSTDALYVLTSNDPTPANRTFTLSSGGSAGQILMLEFNGPNSAELLNSGNVNLTADWTPTNGEILSLLWDSSDSVWNEVSRQQAGGAGGGDLWSDPVNANIVPDGNGTRNLGTFGTNVFNEMHANAYYVFDFADPSNDTGYIYGNNNRLFLSGYTGDVTDMIIEADGTIDIIGQRTGNNSSDITINTANAVGGGTVGNILIQTGVSGSNTPEVKIDSDLFKIEDTSLGSAANGYVWTLQDNATGEGAWAAAGGGGGGVSPDLSDLTAPTAINQELLYQASLDGRLETSGSTQITTLENDNSNNAQSFLDDGDADGSSRAQQFTASKTGTIDRVFAPWYCGGTGTMRVGIMADNSDLPSGTYITFQDFDLAADCPNISPDYTEFIFTGTAAVTSGVKYWIVFEKLNTWTGGVTASWCQDIGDGSCLPDRYAVKAGAGAWGVNINGDLNYRIPIDTGVNKTPDIVVSSGSAGVDDSGDVILRTGIVPDAKGSIIFEDGSEGTLGDCWRSTDAFGTGNWERCLTEFTQGEFRVYDIADNLGIDFDVSAVTGVDKTITMPDTDVDLADIATNAADITSINNEIGTLNATPTNYTPTDPAVIADHLDGIDTEFTNIDNTIAGLGSTYATRALDNLSAVAINADLEYAEGQTGIIRTIPQIIPVNVANTDDTLNFNMLDSGDVIGESRAQSFTAGATGTIPSINLPWYSTGTGTMRIGIMGVSGTLPDDVYIAQVDVDLATDFPNSYPTYNTFTFDTPASVTSGTQYYIVLEMLDPVISGNVSARYCSPQCLGGERYAINLTGASWSENTSRDLAFDVDVLAPGPSTDMIVGSGDANDDTGRVILRPGTPTGGVKGFIFRDGESRSADTTESITADDQALVIDSDIVFLNSDSATATDRTITLPTPQFSGQEVKIIVLSNAVELLDSGNANLSATFTGNAGDSLSLLTDGTTWYETSRSDN